MYDFRSTELPEFRTWSQGFQPPAGTFAYISQNVSVAAAAVVTELFFPELVSVRGCVLLVSRYEPSNFEEWWDRAEGNCQSVECAMNHIHLWDLFESTGEAEEHALVALAHRFLAQLGGSSLSRPNIRGEHHRRVRADGRNV